MTRFALATLLVTLLALPAATCPFCGSQGQTLAGEIGVADFIVLGKPTNPKPDKDDFTRGTTDIVVEKVIKDHPFLTGKKIVRINRLLPVDPKGKERMLVFAEVSPKPAAHAATAAASTLVLGNVFDNPIDAYRGVEVSADSRLADYMKGAIEVREKDNATKLRFFFDYLDAAELEINSDAYMEFGNSDYPDVRHLAVGLPRDKVFGWLKDPGTPASRLGFYGLLAGHCGKKEDAAVLRQLLDDPTRRFASGIDGLMAGYILLDPKGGWEYLTALIKDQSKQDFSVQHAAVKVLRFFWDFRPDVIDREKVVAGAVLSMQNGDFADFAIEDLRKWGRWELTGQVLKTSQLETHKKEPMVKRAVLKFMLAAEKHDKAAAAYVATARADNPDKVKEYEEILEQERKTAAEAAITAPTATTTKKKPAGGN